MSDHTEPAAALRDAVERLYKVFSAYPLAWWDGPYCCTTEEDEQVLHSKPLRELTGNDLYLTEWHMFLCGRQDVEGFKHLLPRSLELLANGESFTDSEVLADRLSMSGWRHWPAAEKTAVSDFLNTIWRMVLSDMAYHITAEEWLVSLARAGLALDAYLEAWQQDPSPSAVGRLAEMILWNEEELALGELNSAYADEQKDEMRKLARWIVSRAAIEKLQPALCIGLQEDFADCIARANDCLRRIYATHLIRAVVWRISETKHT